jgi:hypothetical protein
VKSNLVTVYDFNTDIRSHVSKHAVAHQILQDNRSAVAETHKIQYLKDSLGAEGMFTTAIEVYNSVAPALTRTFASFSLAMTLARDEMPATPPSLSTQGYAAAATTQPTIPPKMFHKAKAPRPSNDQSPTTLPQYCWCHGCSYHDGTRCRYPKSGHIAAASVWSPALKGDVRQGGSLNGFPAWFQ